MRNFSQDARQQSDPVYEAEVDGIAGEMHQGVAVAELARLLTSREYGTRTQDFFFT